MLDKLYHTFGSFPFLLLMTDGKAHVNKTRLLESLIYAGIGGLVSGYIAVKVIEVKLEIISQKVDKIYSDIYRPMLPKYDDNR